VYICGFVYVDSVEERDRVSGRVLFLKMERENENSGERRKR
jgi:hypothetical protein